MHDFFKFKEKAVGFDAIGNFVVKARGFKLRHLKDLAFEDDHFTYQGEDYPYEKIKHVRCSMTSKCCKVDAVPSGKMGQAFVEVTFHGGTVLKLGQKCICHKLLGLSKECEESVVRVASVLQEITFTQRMETYEKLIESKGEVRWGRYKIGKDGSLFKEGKKLFNLKDENVRNVLYVSYFRTYKKPADIKGTLLRWVLGDEFIDVSMDRDCFLYFMKHYLGILWDDEVVRSKRKGGKQEFEDAVITLAAKLCKADGEVSPWEVQAFKSYFKIDANTYSKAEEVFEKAVESPLGVDDTAQNVYEMFGGGKEPLEYIVIGLIQIADSDGVISTSERAVIKKVCDKFKFSNFEMGRLFLMARKKYRNMDESASAHPIQYLRILGLDTDATASDIKDAYRELARMHHPDLLRAQGVPVKRLQDSEEILKTINGAYKWLLKNFVKEEHKS